MDNIYLVNQAARLPNPSQIETLKVAVGSALPKGYQEFIMKYGGGELNAFLYLLAPEEILKVTAEWHETLVSDFWDEDAGLSQNLREQCYILAYSIDSDLFVFLAEKEKIFCLPRQDNRIYPVGKSLSEMIQWVFRSGKLISAGDGLFYKPDGPTSMVRYRNPNPPSLDSFMEAVKVLGLPDYSIRSEEFIDIFYQKWGAHINYGPRYDQLIVTWNAERTCEFLAVLGEPIAKEGFRMTEKMNVPD